jgi:ABC-type lipoprotein export system ATPase subunit
VVIVTHDQAVAAMATKVFEMRDRAIIKEHINGKGVTYDQYSSKG